MRGSRQPNGRVCARAKHKRRCLTALAKKLGVSQPAPYRHFADREALLATVAVEGFRVFITALKEATSGDDEESKVVRCVHAYVNFGLERHGFYRLMFAYAATVIEHPFIPRLHFVPTKIAGRHDVNGYRSRQQIAIFALGF
jgi:AcrR family transcriptional regulator